MPNHSSKDSSAPVFRLETNDTIIEVTVRDNAPRVLTLKNPAQGWNWTEKGSALRLLEKVTVKGTPHKLSWTYQDFHETNDSDGHTVTLVFACGEPKLELVSHWRARPGVGPVETWTTVENKTGEDIVYEYAEIESIGIDIEAEDTLTLTRLGRGGVAKLGYNLGLLEDDLQPNQRITSTTRNTDDYVMGEAHVPFQFLSSKTHGIYFGYEWSFGKFAVMTGESPLIAHYRAYLWDDDRTMTHEDSKKLLIPAVYIGAYQGDLDDGGNRFKKWFWNYKTPQSFRDNLDEPLVEYCLDDNETSIVSFFEKYDPAVNWGAELSKIDIGWLLGVGVVDGNNQASWFGDDIVKWVEDPEKWPNGMTAGHIAQKYGQKLALYFNNTYLWCDLGKRENREMTKEALLKRFDEYGFQYLRTDHAYENNGREGYFGHYENGPFYLSHEGFMEVLDFLIASRPDFRYEGGMKDFSTFRRVTVCAQDDSDPITDDCPANNRQSFYASSYVLPAAQLKSDINLATGPQTPEWVNYNMRSGFYGAWMSNPGTPLHFEAYKRNVALYKEKQRPILRGADVYHLLPMCDLKNWDGFQFYNREIDKGSILLFKPSTDAEDGDMKTIRLKGLDRGVSYRLEFQDRKEQTTVMTGAELMDGGLTVTGMTGNHASEIIWIEPVK